jgi:hypothetical protein
MATCMVSVYDCVCMCVVACVTALSKREALFYQYGMLLVFNDHVHGESVSDTVCVNDWSKYVLLLLYSTLSCP